MAGRRFFQRGHASVPTAYLSTGSSGSARWFLAVAALAASAAILFLFSSCMASDAAVEAPKDPLAFSNVSLETGEGAPASLPTTALDGIQGGSLTSAGDPSSSGLLPQSLSDEGMARVSPLLGQAEARLIAVYRLISQGQHREALKQAGQLVRDHPNFHLAHLVHGDLLSLQMRPVRQLGDVPDTKARAAAQQLSVLRDESRRRLLALTERPAEGSVPTQFLSLSSQSRHAIAIDASRSRLYLFENQTPSASGSQIAPPPRLKLLGDFYISVGLSGIEKTVEGDKRTPLGVYYITSNLNPDNLPDLYGVGALPINYPNPLDIQRGKTGSGIWLHGTPREQFVRAPLASDGCVVLSNPDLEKLLKTVQIRTTPVVIAPQLEWVQPVDQDADRRAFEAALESWRTAKSSGQVEQLKSLYSPRFQSGGKEGGKESGQWARQEAELRNGKGTREIQLKDVSFLRWQDTQDTMVVTFGEVAVGQSRGVTRRQYWARENDQWKIFYEGNP
jgi:lipoprotein-anchoring transpeptidase ErfK/SrfK